MRRLLPCCALLVVAAFAPASVAAPCRPLLSDPVGDARGLPAAVPYDAGPDPALDVLRADLVADRRNLTAVLRVAHLDEPAPHTARVWRVHWTIPMNEQRYWLEVVQAVNGIDAAVGRYNLPSEAWDPDRAGGLFARATATLNLDAGEVRVTVPLRAFDEYTSIRQGTQAYAITAMSGKHVGYAGGTESAGPVHVHRGSTGAEYEADNAATSRRYRVGSPGCVKP